MSAIALANNHPSTLPIRQLRSQGSGVLPRRNTRQHLRAIAELSSRLPRRAGEAIEILLAAARPFDDGFSPLRPLWTQEALHRALSMLRLFTALQRRDPAHLSKTSIDERQLALDLAAELASLETTDLRRNLPCSGPLRETVRNLVELFGGAAGRIVLDISVTPLILPAFQRRALVLLGDKLVTSALTHAFEGRGNGKISVHLARVDACHARLAVSDDGIGFIHGRPDPVASVAGGLSDLLEGEIRYRGVTGSGTTAELVFPTL